MRKVLVSMAVIVVLVVVLAAFLISNYGAPASEDVEETKPFHFGVTFGGNTTAEAKLLIDRVKDYTNVFFLQSGPVSTNETAVNEICDYAVDAGLDIIVYFGDLDTRFMNESKFWRINWLSYAKQRWGDSLLGVQYYDEPGGMFIDMNQTVWTDSWNMSTERDYDLAANVFNHLSTDWGFMQLETNGIDSFVTDYALYWFDYSIGYDIVLAQAGWNHSLTQDIALIRGAANMKNRNWGIIVTWTYSQPPYLDSGEATYEQMLAAYKAGADYIIIFNYPSLEGNNYGIMQDEHFEAMERFWNETVNNKQLVHGEAKAEAALVLPRNYGWGMRHPNDQIWGWWGPDEKSPQIWQLSRQLLTQYGLRIDIVYEDSAFPVQNKYPQIHYWNETN